MKKVLIIPSWYPNTDDNGSGIFFLEQSRLLSEDFEIRLLNGVKRKNISRLKKIWNTILFLITRSVVCTVKKKYFIEPPQVYGFEYECGINMLKGVNYRIMMLSYLKAFNRILAEWQPGIIHAHDIYPGGLAASYINKEFNIPYMISEHNYLRFSNPWFINKDTIRAIEHSKKMLSVSEYLYRNLKMHITKCDPFITGNFVDDNIFTLAEIKERNAAFTVLFIGRDSVDKDFPTLIRTINEFDNLNQDKDYFFIIVGSLGHQKEKIIGELARIDVRKNLEFKEKLDRKAMVDIIHSSDVLLSTSISETFGLGMCEAMMCGVPVVSTNNGGFDEMYISGINGIKTGIGDYKALAGSLYKIKTGEITFDPLLIRESVRNKFGTLAFKTRLSTIYNSVHE